MGAAASCLLGPSAAVLATRRARVVGVLRNSPCMQMLDDTTLSEVAGCFQAIKYTPGVEIRHDPWMFFVVAEGSVNVSSLLPTTKNKGRHLQEVLCQRRVGEFVSFAAREQLLARLQDDTPHGDGKKARKNLVALLDLNRVSADPAVGCTLLKLNRAQFLALRAQGRRRSTIQPTTTGRPRLQQTGRFSHDERRQSTLTRPEKLHVLSSIIESEVMSYLLEIPFLEDVDESRLVTLSNLCSYQYVRRGDVLCREGELGDRFFICIRGELQASVEARSHAQSPFFTSSDSDTTSFSGIVHADTHTLPLLQQRNKTDKNGDALRLQALRRLGTGAYFGEISLLFHVPRVCSITALSDSLLVYIERVAFCNFFKIVPSAGLVLLEHVRLQFLDMLVKQDCTFLSAMPPLKLQELSYLGDLLEHATGTMVLEHGHPPTGFYIVLRGEVEMEYFPITPSKTNTTTTEKAAAHDTAVAFGEMNRADSTSTMSTRRPREVVRVRAGGYFGQEALILATTSPVAVRCVDHCLTLRLSSSLFDEFFASLPEVYAEFCLKCLRDKASPAHVMQHYAAHKLWAADCVTRRRNHEVEFFEFIEDFKWEVELSEGGIHARALLGYAKYLADDAPRRVALTPHVVSEIEDELASHGVHASIFDHARQELLKSMNDDRFRAFKQSLLFQEFLSTLCCPQTIYDGLTPAQIERLEMSSRTPSDGREPLELEDVDDDTASTSAPASRPASIRDLALPAASSSSITRSYARHSLSHTLESGAPLGNPTRRKTRGDINLHRALSTSFVV